MFQLRRWGRVRMAAVGALALGMSACRGGGSQASRLGDSSIASVKVVATVAGPTDAAPSPDGSVFYLLGNDNSQASIQRVPASGGTPAILHLGAPLRSPKGVAVSTDGSQVFVADPLAGRVFSVPSAGGTPSVVAGTEGRSPRGLDVIAGQGSDIIYFTGVDPADGAPGVFSVPAAGGAVTVVAKGSPLVSPDAVVVTGSAVYLSDRGGATNRGAVFKVSGSAVIKVTDVALGDPGGVSVTANGKTLLVSSQNPATGADQVLLVDLATGKTGTVTKVIGANHNSAGGVHRAFHGTVFAWADDRRSGRVYRVEP